MTSTGIAEHRPETADDILELLFPRPCPSHPFGMREPIFRGVSDSEFRLVPAALRDPTWASGDLDPWFVEFAAVEHFTKACDRSGLSVPRCAGEPRSYAQGSAEHGGHSRHVMACRRETDGSFRCVA